jgi:hypothetical protein
MPSIISKINDAAISPEAWPLALEALTNEAGVGGAALIISNKATGIVEEVCFVGLSAAFQADYINQYAALDPYLPLLDGTWTKLSECLPGSTLRKSEWYNDFVLACGVRDILATRLVDTQHHRVIFGIHQELGRSFSNKVDNVIDLVGVPLKHAAWRHLLHLPPKSVSLDKFPALTEGNRYFFHIDNGRSYPDETGSIFSTAAQAIAHGIVVAQELAQDSSWHEFTVAVADQRGKELARIHIGA